MIFLFDIPLLLVRNPLYLSGNFTPTARMVGVAITRICWFCRNPIRPGGEGGANLTPPGANTYTCKRSLGRNSGNFSHIPKFILGMLETTFHGQKSGDH